MGKVLAQMSMSLDGFVTGPDPSQNNPLGTNGERLHDWIFANPDGENTQAIALKKTTGAAIIGYNMYFEAIPYWEGTGPLGDEIPTFVLTEKDTAPQDAPAVFTFVTDGIESALEKAQVVAGDKDVWIGGGANTIRQYLKANLLDELHIHLISLLLGGGTSLFGSLNEYIELEKISVQDEPGVTHLIYRRKG
jgi:dihydrofolate reductase